MLSYFVLLLSVTLSLSQPDCSKIPDAGGSGLFYDLSALVGKELQMSDTYSKYKTTICKNTYDTCGNCGGPAGYCQYTDNWADCVGKFSVVTGMQGSQKGVDLLYDGGDWGSVGRIKITCNPNLDMSEPVAEQNPKTMVIQSKHACLTAGGIGNISLGTTIMIVVLCLTVIYFVGGVIYYRYRHDKTGIEMIPHIEFWKSLPYYVKDGVVFTTSSIRNLVSQSS